jgi:hypothetical protein
MDNSAEAAGPDTILSIELTNGAKSIKEIYYANGNGSVFTNKPTKKALLGTLIFTLLSGLFYLLSFSNQVAWIFLLVLALGGVVVYLLIFSYRAKYYFKWREGVSAHLKQVSKYDKQFLTLNDHSFELTNKDKTVIEKWKNVRKAFLSSTHMMLNCESGSQYLFPAGSMEAAKYEALKEFVRQKMNCPAVVKEKSLTDNVTG